MRISNQNSKIAEATEAIFENRKNLQWIMEEFKQEIHLIKTQQKDDKVILDRVEDELLEELEKRPVIEESEGQKLLNKLRESLKNKVFKRINSSVMAMFNIHEKWIQDMRVAH